MHDYHLSLFDAMHRFPIVVAIALWPARAERLGDDQGGPDWADVMAENT